MKVFGGRLYIATQQEIEWGSYICRRCSRRYSVNEAGKWLCTAEFCHECLDYLNKQYALIPVDKDGKQTKSS